jgi:hypothetical protein
MTDSPVPPPPFAPESAQSAPLAVHNVDEVHQVAELHQVGEVNAVREVDGVHDADESVVFEPVQVQRPAGSFARPLLIAFTGIATIAALGMLLVRTGEDTTSIKAGSVPVPVAAAPAPLPIPIDTVVAPLNQVSFDPPPPAFEDDLTAYAGELSEAIRPVINVSYTGIKNEPAPWSSHLYGPADLPASVPVPVDDAGQPLCMVAQINLADLPAFPAVQGNPATISKLPRTGVLQFWLALSAPGTSGWTGGPTLVETADNPRQRVVYISGADVAAAPAKREPTAGRCTGAPPAQGPVVTLGMSFELGWNAPETTDSRFDSALPSLAAALRATPADEFYRATTAISDFLGGTPGAQIGGFNRLVNADPRTIGAPISEDEIREGVITDSFEVLFELHTVNDPDERFSVGFGNSGSGGWWVDPKVAAALGDSAGPTAGRSTVVQSAFWWDAQATPAS